MVVNTSVNAVAVSNNTFVRPDSLDDSGDTFFYFGWESVGGSWLVRRQVRASSAVEDAKVADNVAYADLTAAWLNKATLVYG